MRAYTIVVHPAPEEERHIATVPDLPGWVTEGRTVEECVERAREAIVLYDEDVELAGAPLGPREWSSWPTEELMSAAEVPSGSGDPAAEEAVDALRRAMAALRTVEVQVEEEIGRLPIGEDRRPLRRAHVALLRARRSLAVEDLALERVPE